jgi:hypothetical protein
MSDCARAHKELIIKNSTGPREWGNLNNLESFDDLVKASEILLKPILLHESEAGHVFWLYDGDVEYRNIIPKGESWWFLEPGLDEYGSITETFIRNQGYETAKYAWNNVGCNLLRHGWELYHRRYEFDGKVVKEYIYSLCFLIASLVSAGKLSVRHQALGDHLEVHIGCAIQFLKTKLIVNMWDLTILLYYPFNIATVLTAAPTMNKREWVVCTAGSFEGD